eukprot:scaffold138594_cov28-Tisochrysis_lutea.AAC.1
MAKHEWASARALPKSVQLVRHQPSPFINVGARAGGREHNSSAADRLLGRVKRQPGAVRSEHEVGSPVRHKSRGGVCHLEARCVVVHVNASNGVPRGFVQSDAPTRVDQFRKQLAVPAHLLRLIEEVFMLQLESCGRAHHNGPVKLPGVGAVVGNGGELYRAGRQLRRRERFDQLPAQPSLPLIEVRGRPREAVGGG